MATLVSWRFAEITNSLLMKTPVPGENGASSKRRAFRCQALRRVIQWTVYPVCHDHKSLDLVRRRCDSLTPFKALNGTARIPKPRSSQSNLLTLNLLESRPFPARSSSQIAGAAHCLQAPAS